MKLDLKADDFRLQGDMTSTSPLPFHLSLGSKFDVGMSADDLREVRAMIDVALVEWRKTVWLRNAEEPEESQNQ